tara:strand:- start:1098 stop:1784 length:687 start_codon:yes stop_codon:yes gene_type:complete
MKFLNYDKVLCLSVHPDDVEYGMLGTIMKYKDTHFDVLVLSEGGDFDKSSSKNRHKECQSVWNEIDNLNGFFLDYKHVKDTLEDELISKIENECDIDSYDCIFVPSEEDAHFEHKKISTLSYPLTRRLKCGLIQFKTPSTLDLWIPNFFIDLYVIENRNKEDGHSPETHLLFQACIWYIKLNKLKLFTSQQDKSYFDEPSLKSFHSNYQCSMRGLTTVESFKIIRGYN